MTTTTGHQNDVLDLYSRALHDFGAYVHGVDDAQWSAPTPCTDWDVTALVNHVVGENRWAVPLFAGSTIAEVGPRLDGDLLGGTPVPVWDESAAAALRAVSEPGAMERVVHLSFGDFPGSEYAMQLFADLLIHGWDLASATGQDARLDPGLVDACAAWFAGVAPDYRAGGAVAPMPQIPSGADAQARLLAEFGRVSAG